MKALYNLTTMFTLSLLPFTLMSCDDDDSSSDEQEEVATLDEENIQNYLLTLRTDKGAAVTGGDNLLPLEVRKEVILFDQQSFNYTLDNSQQSIFIYNVTGGDLGSGTGTLILNDATGEWTWTDSSGRDLTGRFSPITR